MTIRLLPVLTFVLLTAPVEAARFRIFAGGDAGLIASGGFDLETQLLHGLGVSGALLYNDSGQSRVDAFARPGRLGISSRTEMYHTRPPGAPANSGSNVFVMMIADAIFLGPSSAPIDVSLNFGLSGMNLPGGCNNDERRIVLVVPSLTAGNEFCNGGPHGGVFTEVPDPDHFSGVFTTGSFTVTPGVPVELTFLLGVRNVLKDPGAISVMDWDNTFSLPTSGLVFNVPDGFTVNIPDLNVSDNVFVPDPEVAIPEPSLAALNAAVLAAVCLLRLRRPAARR